MRKLLNNPVIVIPLACFALLWLLHNYGLTQYLLKQFVGQTRRVDAAPFVQNNKANASTKSEKAMGTLVADRWLISSWARTSIAKNEPFVANGLQKKSELPDTLEIEIEIEDEEMVVVDKETFDAALVSTLGLDQKGYFVVFENVLNQPVRKRVGDVIYLEGSGPLMIPTFGIAEARRTSEEIRVLAESMLANFSLLGVGAEEVAEEESSFSENSMNIAFIQLADGKTGIFKQGDLVARDPHLGLDQVIKGVGEDTVVLVDQYANKYSLSSVYSEN